MIMNTQPPTPMSTSKTSVAVRFPSLRMIAALSLATAPMLSAATYTWDNASNNSWNTAANWNPDTLPTFDNQADLVFNSALAAIGSSFITSNRIVRSITAGDSLSNNGGLYTIQTAGLGNNTVSRDLTFSADSGNASINIGSNSTLSRFRLGQNLGRVILNSNLDINNNSASTIFHIDTAVSQGASPAAINVNSNGGMVALLRGSTFSGGLNINAGNVLVYNNNGALGAGLVRLGQTGSSTNAALYVGVNYPSGNLTYSNNITVSSGSGTRLIANSDVLTHAAYQASQVPGVPTLNGTIDLSAGKDVTVDVKSYIANTTDKLILGGVISGTGGIAKTGNGTLILNAANTYSGNTTINDGALSVTSAGSLASGSALSIASGATANLSNAGQNLGAVSNANTASDALNFSASTGTVTLTSLSGAGNTRFGNSAVITGGIGSGTVNAVGSLTANITGGTTTVGGVATIGTMSAGTANLNGATSSITTYNGGGLALGNSTVLSVSAGNSSSVISGGGSLTKTSAGTLTLTGTNTYTGLTTVSGGALAVNGSVAGAMSVASGATLQGSGTIGGATTVSGNLNPGNSPGLLTFANSLTLESTAVTTMEITGIGDRGVTYDAVNVANALTYGGTLTLDFSGDLYTEGVYTFDLFNFNSTSGSFGSVSLAGVYSGSFTDNSGIWGLTDGDNNWSFNQGDGILTFTVVPEPNVAMVAGSLVLMAMLRRRRD